jgi:integrase/recombinase XerD
MATKQRKAPPGCYWRGDTLWGRKRVKGREFRWSLHTDDPKIAWERFKAGTDRALADAHHGDGRRSLDEVTEAWAEQLSRTVSAKTRTRYLCSLEQIGPDLEGLDVADINGKLVAEIINQRRRAGVTDATIKRDLVALSSLVNYAIDQGWTESNPVLPRMRLLKERRDPIFLPSHEDIALVLDRAPVSLRFIIEAALKTGAREEELVLATCDRFDSRRHQLTLIGKGNKRRVIDLDPFGGIDLFRSLPSYIGKPSCPWLFWHGEGECYSIKSFAGVFYRHVKRVERFAKKHGLRFRRFRFHDLRHRHAVDWLQSGRSIYDLEYRLGHSSLQVTELYLEFLDENEQHTARRGAVDFRRAGGHKSGHS